MSLLRAHPLRLIPPVALAGLLGGCGTSGSVAARAGDQVLTSERLAEIVQGWQRAPADTGLARRVAEWWVESQLMAQRIAAGDSLLDSTTVVEVLWPETRAFVLAGWRKQLFDWLLPLDSASLDSVYQAGTYRWIQHILIRAPEGGPADQRTRARERAQALRQRLAGGLSWEGAQRYSEDGNSRGDRGNVGIITPGQTEALFEQAAFALAPGEISPVVASSFGFHIARRPPLAEVRDAYRAAVEPMVAERLDSLHIKELRERWHLALQAGALERAGQAVQDPLRVKESRTVIARFEHGRFTLADLVRWLQAVPDWMHVQVERDLQQGSDQRLTAFLNTMMGYELLYREALDHGVRVTASEFAELKTELAGQLDKVKTSLGVYPPGPGDSAGVPELERRAAEKVDRYFLTLPEDWQRFARVPPPLADRLKRQARWAVNPRGIRRSLQRVAELQAAADSIPERL